MTTSDQQETLTAVEESKPNPTQSASTTAISAVQPGNVALLAEDDDWDETDSAIGSPSISSSTTSLAESILKHRRENGRTFHAYKEGKYMAPNDEGENDRLDLQHHLCTLMLDSKLYLSPAGKENKLHRVLDVGTGTGIWAIDFADEHPEAEVFGVDLSPIQPQFVPPNVRFQIDDLEEEWTFTQPFDFIYSRFLIGSFNDWPRFFDQCYKNLNPGGFVELLDAHYPLRTDDNTFPPNSALSRWSSYVMQGLASINRNLDEALRYKDQLAAAGFVNIVQVDYKLPLNRWPKDKKLKELGVWSHESLCGGLSGLSLATFTRLLGWSVEELEVFLVDVRKELKDPKIHSYMSIVVVYGQKPGGAAST